MAVSLNMSFIIFFNNKKTWISAFHNSFYCLIGCSIGDFGTILYFQFQSIYWYTWQIMLLAIINGIVTSIILETIILLKRMRLVYAFKTALGMSLISMLIMETIMNMVDIAMMGGAFLSIEIIPIILISGWIAAAPYNYYRIKKYDISCH